MSNGNNQSRSERRREKQMKQQQQQDQPKVDGVEVPVKAPNAETKPKVEANVQTSAPKGNTTRHNKPKVDNPAPQGLFKKNDHGFDQSKITIIESHLKSFVANCGKNSTDLKVAAKHAKDLTAVVRMISTLKGKTLNRAMGILVKEIKSCENKAFDKAYLYRFIGDIKQTKERDNFIKFMNVVTGYAKAPSVEMFNELTDVKYSLSGISDNETRTGITAFLSK